MKNIWSLSMLLISTVLLGCGGGGGGSSNSDASGGNPSAYVWPTGSSPLTVATSSYENKNAAQLVRTQLEKFDPNVSSVSVTFGDFFQDGQFSAFIVVNQSGTTGKVYFLRWKTATSAWVDDTDRILASTERSACVSSQYAITADFNGDQKPDVYLSCASSQQPVAQLLFLSQSGGSYRKKTSEIVVDGKSAAALDINGDGKLDLIASHVTSTTRGEPQVYFGDGLGGFSFQTRGSALVAQDTQNNCGGDSIPASIDSVSVVPSTSGRFDLILGSTGASNSIVWLKDLSPSSSPRYSVCSSKAFPNLTDTARLTDVYSSVSNAATSFYLARKSSPEAMSITKFSLTETPGNGGLSTTYTLTKGLQPVVLNAAGGLPDLFKLNGSVFQAFDAGCSTQTIRCSSLSASLSAIN